MTPESGNSLGKADMKDLASPRILLVRHGKPSLEKKVATMSEWLQGYDEAKIDPRHPPPARLQALAAEVDVWLCSSLPRATSSLALLAPTAKPLVHDIFKEAPLPPVEKPQWLPLGFWLAYLRGRWMQGSLNASESLQDCQKRTQKAVEIIASHTGQEHTIGVMGHGFFNHLMVEVLKTQGWRQTYFGRGFWSHRTLALKR